MSEKAEFKSRNQKDVALAFKCMQRISSATLKELESA